MVVKKVWLQKLCSTEEAESEVLLASAFFTLPAYPSFSWMGDLILHNPSIHPLPLSQNHSCRYRTLFLSRK